MLQKLCSWAEKLGSWWTLNEEDLSGEKEETTLNNSRVSVEKNCVLIWRLFCVVLYWIGLKISFGSNFGSGMVTIGAIHTPRNRPILTNTNRIPHPLNPRTRFWPARFPLFSRGSAGAGRVGLVCPALLKTRRYVNVSNLQYIDAILNQK